MRFILFLILATLFTCFSTEAQSYGKKKIYVDYGTWRHDISNETNVSISSYVTKQTILTHRDFKQKQKTLSELPKYRYELILISKSTYYNKTVKTWISNARVFIDNVEVTNEQFPNGFTAVIDVTPTVIYWYETSMESIKVTIKWENCVYNSNN